MQLPNLYAIINIDQHPDPQRYAQQLHTAGVTLIQLRAKQLSAGAFQELAKGIISSFVDSSRPRFIINDSPEIAQLVAADGVHLGQGDGNVEVARKLLGEHAIVGLSTNNESQLRSAPYAALTYIALGPIFHSQTKNGHAPEIGIEQLQLLAKLAKKPLVAIGGITTKNASAVFNAGATSVAVVQELMISSDLRKTVDAFNTAAIRS